jgi:hypothetical protein
MTIEKLPGLNAIGRPFSTSYDPAYRMKYKPSYGHLRAPYGPSMRFVGDPPKTYNGHRRRRRQPPPVPLLDDNASLQKQLNDAHGRLRRVERQIVLAIDMALKKTDKLHRYLLALRAAHSADLTTLG